MVRRITSQFRSLTSLELQYVSKRLHSCRDLELAVPGSYVPNEPLIRISHIHSHLQVSSPAISQFWHCSLLRSTPLCKDSAVLRHSSVILRHIQQVPASQYCVPLMSYYVTVPSRNAPFYVSVPPYNITVQSNNVTLPPYYALVPPHYVSHKYIFIS